MQCYKCEDVVEWCGDEGVKWFLEDLRREMDGWGAWEVDERCVERWDWGFEKMIPLLRGRQVEGCWLLEQVKVTEQGHEAQVGEAEDEGDQGEEGGTVELGIEDEVAERQMDGLEALKLIGGEGFTADGFIRHKSPLWGSVVDEEFDDESMGEESLSGDFMDNVSVNGEFDGDANSQELFKDDDDINTAEKLVAIQASPLSETVEVKEPTIIKIGEHDQFVVDMLDASTETSSESDVPDDMDTDGGGIDTDEGMEDFESSVASDDMEDDSQDFHEVTGFSSTEAASEEGDDTNSIFDGKDDSTLIAEMDFDDSPGSEESESKNLDHEDEQETFTESEDQIHEEEESDIATSESNLEGCDFCDFKDHQRYPLGDTMEIGVLRELKDSESDASDADQTDTELDDFEDLAQDAETHQYSERDCVDEENSEFEPDSGGELDTKSIGGEADDEEGDEVLNDSSSDHDMQMGDKMVSQSPRSEVEKVMKKITITTATRVSLRKKEGKFLNTLAQIQRLRNWTRLFQTTSMKLNKLFPLDMGRSSKACGLIRSMKVRRVRKSNCLRGCADFRGRRGRQCERIWCLLFALFRMHSVDRIEGY